MLVEVPYPEGYHTDPAKDKKGDPRFPAEQ